MSILSLGKLNQILQQTRHTHTHRVQRKTPILPLSSCTAVQQICGHQGSGLALNMPANLTPCWRPCWLPRNQYFSAAFCINSNYTHEWGIFIWSDRISGHYAPHPPCQSVRGQQSTSASHLETHALLCILCTPWQLEWGRMA